MRVFVVAITALMLFTSSNAYAAWKNTGSHTYSRLCPLWIGGDKEYDGHGPEVNASIELYTSASGRELWMDVYMHQIETRSDYTECELDRRFLIYRAPAGERITRIYSNGDFYEIDGAGGPVEDIFYVDTDHGVDWFYPETFVDRIAIVGDTRGNDVDHCTDDDAYLSVYLNSIWVWYE